MYGKCDEKILLSVETDHCTNSKYCSWLVFIVIYLVVLYRRAVSEKEEKRGKEKRGKRGRREAGNVVRDLCMYVRRHKGDYVRSS